MPSSQAKTPQQDLSTHQQRSVLVAQPLPQALVNHDAQFVLVQPNQAETPHQDLSIQQQRHIKEAPPHQQSLVYRELVQPDQVMTPHQDLSIQQQRHIKEAPQHQQSQGNRDDQVALILIGNLIVNPNTKLTLTP